MGLIDRLVSGLIKNATGVDARRIVRRVGGKNILLAGGAAIAGAALADRQQTGTGAPAPGMTPAPGAAPGAPPYVPQTTPSAAPLPPIPGAPPPPAPPSPAAVPPPPPPVPMVEDTSTTLSPRLTYAVVRTLVAGAMADGHLDDAERTLIESNLTDSDLPPEQVARIRADMADPPSPFELASMVETDEERATLLQFGELIVRADGDTSAMEEGWLDRLAEALGIDTKPAESTAAEPAADG